MAPIDQRNKLDEDPFSYQIFKDGRVQVSWNRKPVMILKGSKAADLCKKLEEAEGKETQLILAKVTGNFKHGNEKQVQKNGPGGSA